MSEKEEVETVEEAEEITEAEAVDNAEEAEDTEEAEEGEAEEAAEEADGEEADGDEDDEESDKHLGERAQKRIGKLVKERNAAQADVEKLQKQLEQAKRLGGDDGRALLSAAEKSGILPGLMSNDEAEAFEALERLPGVVESYRDWLDDHESGEELELGNGKALSYGDVRKRARKLERELGELRERYGERKKELGRKVREIFEAGIEALKHGKKPEKAAKAKPNGEWPKPKRKTLETPEASSPRHRRRNASIEEMDVENENDLEAYITEMRRHDKDNN